MSLEQTLAANTEALIANTAALLAAKGAASTGTAATTGESTKTAKPAKDKVVKEEVVKATKTREELAAAMGAYKEKFGTPKAKEIILSVGGTPGLADVPEANIDALFNAATKAVEEAEESL